MGFERDVKGFISSLIFMRYKSHQFVHREISGLGAYLCTTVNFFTGPASLYINTLVTTYVCHAQIFVSQLWFLSISIKFGITVTICRFI